MELLTLLQAAEAVNETAGSSLEGFSGALVLMMIGMTVVFTVLLLVIWLGNILITVVNKYCPEEEQPKALQTNSNNIIDPLTSEAIAKAVAQLTGGKGKVESITKL